MKWKICNYGGPKKLILRRIFMSILPYYYTTFRSPAIPIIKTNALCLQYSICLWVYLYLVNSCHHGKDGRVCDHGCADLMLCQICCHLMARIAWSSLSHNHLEIPCFCSVLQESFYRSWSSNCQDDFISMDMFDGLFADLFTTRINVIGQLLDYLKNSLFKVRNIFSPIWSTPFGFENSL